LKSIFWSTLLEKAFSQPGEMSLPRRTEDGRSACTQTTAKIGGTPAWEDFFPRRSGAELNGLPRKICNVRLQKLEFAACEKRYKNLKIVTIIICDKLFSN
jgi:hypothetical protein